MLLVSAKKGDVVFFKEGTSFVAGHILLNFSVAGLAISIVIVWTLEAAGDGCAKWTTQSPRRKLIETAEIVDVAIHTKVSHGLVSTLLPPECRQL